MANVLELYALFTLRRHWNRSVEDSLAPTRSASMQVMRAIILNQLCSSLTTCFLPAMSAYLVSLAVGAHSSIFDSISDTSDRLAKELRFLHV